MLTLPNNRKFRNPKCLNLGGDYTGTRASFLAESALASMSEPSQERTPFVLVRGQSR